MIKLRQFSKYDISTIVLLLSLLNSGLRAYEEAPLEAPEAQEEQREAKEKKEAQAAEAAKLLQRQQDANNGPASKNGGGEDGNGTADPSTAPADDVPTPYADTGTALPELTTDNIMQHLDIINSYPADQIAAILLSLNPQDFALIMPKLSTNKILELAAKAALIKALRAALKPFDFFIGNLIELLFGGGIKIDQPHKEAINDLLRATIHDADANVAGQSLIVNTKTGNTRTVDALLAYGRFNVNMVDKEGNTALHWAVLTNKPELVTALLEKGAKADQANNIGLTPIASAVSGGNIAILNTLLKREDVGINTNPGKATNPLTLAIQAKRPDMLLALLNKSAATLKLDETTQVSVAKIIIQTLQNNSLDATLNQIISNNPWMRKIAFASNA